MRLRQPAHRESAQLVKPVRRRPEPSPSSYASAHEFLALNTELLVAVSVESTPTETCTSWVLSRSQPRAPASGRYCVGIRSFDDVHRVCIEGTGSCGAGVCGHLADVEVLVMCRARLAGTAAGLLRWNGRLRRPVGRATRPVRFAPYLSRRTPASTHHRMTLINCGRPVASAAGDATVQRPISA
jgi:hypothetical protein